MGGSKLFSEFLTNAGEYMGTTATNAGILLSLIITVTVIIIIALAMKGKNFEMTSLGISFFMVAIFTFMDWLPLWLGAVLGLGVAMMSAFMFRNLIGGN